MDTTDEKAALTTDSPPVIDTQGALPSDAPAPQGANSPEGTDKAGSSAAPAEAKKPKTALEAVEQALQKQRSAQQPVAQPEAPKAGKSPSQDAEDGDGSDEADDADEGTDGLKAKTKARIERLLADKADLAPKAKAYEDLHGFLRGQGVTQDEFAQSLNFLVLSKTDPVAFLSALDHLVAETRKNVGLDVLPADLQSKVEQGLVDEATAQELHAQRTSASHTRQQQQARSEQEQADRQQQEQQEHTRAIVDAVSSWEKATEQTDADFPRIRKLVHAEAVRLMNTEGAPRTPQQAVEQARKALNNVKAELGGLVPRKQPVKFVPSGGNGQSEARPRSALEAVEMTLRGQRPAY